jgi:hypothetical protein
VGLARQDEPPRFPVQRQRRPHVQLLRLSLGSHDVSINQTKKTSKKSFKYRYLGVHAIENRPKGIAALFGSQSGDLHHFWK